MQLKPCLEGEIIDLKSSIRREERFYIYFKPKWSKYTFYKYIKHNVLHFCVNFLSEGHRWVKNLPWGHRINRWECQNLNLTCLYDFQSIITVSSLIFFNPKWWQK